MQGSAEDMGTLCAGHDVTALSQLPQMLTAIDAPGLSQMSALCTWTLFSLLHF